MNRQRFFPLLFLLCACTCVRAQLICGDDDCGDIQVGYVGENSEVVLCEGARIVLRNESEMGYERFVIDWGDANRDTVFNYDPVNHIYNFAPDEDGSCNDRQFFRVQYLGQVNCAAGESCQSGAIDFTVEPKPVARIVVSNEVCAGRPVDFTSNSCNATNFRWDFGDGTTSTEENPTHTYTSEGTFTVRLNVSGIDACTAFNDDAVTSVTIVNPPDAVFTVSDDDLIACRGETIRLINRSNDDTNITWEINPGSADGSNWRYADEDQNEFSDTIDIVFVRDRDYTITLTGRNDCDEVEEEREISIREAPNVSELDDLAGCDVVSVSPAALGAVISGDFTEVCWSFPDGNATDVCSESFAAVDFMASGRVLLTVTSLCGEVTREAMVTVQSSAPPTLTAEPQYCTGSTPDTLRASAPGGSWSGPGITNAALGVFDPTVAGAGTHTIRYEITNGACDNENTVDILVQESVAVTADDAEVCADAAAFTLTATPGGGTWSGPGVTDASGTFDPALAGAGEARPVYAFTDPNNGCSVEVSPRINVAALPVITAPDTAVTCNEDETVDLAALTTIAANVSGGSFTWTLNGNSLTTSTFNPTTDLPGPGDYPLDYAYTNDPCAVTGRIVLRVIEKPVLMLEPLPLLCLNGAPVDLVANLAGGSWSGTGVSGSTFDPAVAGVGTFTLNYDITAGTCRNAGTLTVEVIPGANLTATDAEFCLDGEATQLSALPVGGEWSGPGITAPDGTFDPGSAGVGVVQPTYTFVDSDGCTLTARPEVTVFAVPGVMAVDTAIACLVGDAVSLPEITTVASNVAGGDYTWTLNGTELPGQTFVPTDLGGAGVYPVTFVYENGPCVVTGGLELEVIDNPQLVLDPQDNVCISAGTLQLGANLGGGQWSGAGVDPVTGLVDLTAAGGGAFTYGYSFQPGGSCAQTADQTITIEDPGADITAGGDQQVCELVETTFTLTGAFPAGGQWVGPGITDPAAGTVDLTQLVSGQSYEYTYEFESATTPGCTAAAGKELRYDAAPNPNYTIDGSPCINESFALAAAQSGGGFSFAWDFGDGTTSSAPNPTHTYMTGGNFVQTLQVTSPQGCPADTTATIYVTTPPSPNFALDSTLGCAAFALNLDDNSTGDDFTSFWRVAGDTLRGGDTLVVLDGYLEDTEVEIILTAQNFCGARTQVQSVTVKPYPVVDFGLNLDDGCSPFTPQLSNVTRGNPDTFAWDMGEGTTGTDSLPPVVSYFTPADSVSTYTITLVSANECGADTLRRELTVHPPDVSAFIGLDTISGCQPWTFAPRSFSTPGAELAWEVLAPDGTIFASGNDAAPSFELTEAGLHRVILRAARCGEDADTVFVDVLPAPEVAFTADPAVCRGTALTLTNTSTDIAGGFYVLSTGDTLDQLNTEIVLPEAGDYTLSFTGFSALNACPATVSQSLRVHPLPPVPTISVSDDSGCGPLSITLRSTASSAADLDYTWDFGGGTGTSTEPTPTHVYPEAGEYFPRLTITDSVGCSRDTFFSRITVFPDPTADFVANNRVFCGGADTLLLQDASLGATALRWTVAGEEYLGTPPPILLTEAGTVTVTLEATSANGCVDVATQSIAISGDPVADFPLPPARACSPYLLQLTATATEATRYEWYVDDAFAPAVGPTLDTLLTENRSYNLRLIAIYADACRDTLDVSDLVRLDQGPVAGFTFAEDTDPNRLGDVIFQSTSTGGDEYFWNLGDGTVRFDRAFTHEYRRNRDIVVTHAITQRYDQGLVCSDTLRQNIAPEWLTTFYVPNAISPETGPEEVRQWGAKGFGVVSYDLQVFSPYGQLVFRTDELMDSQPVGRWNGRLETTGDYAPQGAYTWRATVEYVDGNRETLVGTVTVVR